MQITLPDGYQVVEMPESERVIIRGYGGDFNYIVQQDGNKLNLISKIQLRQLKYLPENYIDIKEFFERIADKLQQPIRLQRKADR